MSRALAVVILGASQFSEWQEMNSRALSRSASAFKRYAESIVGKPSDDILDLFDHPDSPDHLIRKVQDFLESLSKRHTNTTLDLITYYVGHGDTTDDRRYLLAITNSRQDISATSLDTHSLTDAFKPVARIARIYLILDACFSGQVTDAFKQPVSSRGLAALVSSSRADTSSLRGASGKTVFTEAMLAALTIGVPELPTRLSLRGLRDAINTRIADSGLETSTHAEVHSPYQRSGDVSDELIFFNPGSVAIPPQDRPRQPPSDARWCCVVSAADRADESVGPFEDVINSIEDSHIAKIRRTTEWQLADEPIKVYSDEVFSSVPTLIQSIKYIAQAELCFFDLTDHEPAVMFLLGVRSVMRRGVTICSTTKDSAKKRDADPQQPDSKPFHLREVTTTLIDPHLPVDLDTRPSVKLASRAAEGIRQVSRAPSSYLDLPAFEHIRMISPDPSSRKIRPYSEAAIVLCSFSDKYQRRNWPRLRGKLFDALQWNIDRDQALTMSERGGARVERTLDMMSPRIASSALFEALRLTDFCVCDLTEWRPNVLFELGVRYAAHQLDPICIVDETDETFVASASQEADTPRQRRVADQVRMLSQLIPLMSYNPRDRSRERYRAIVQRHLEYRGSSSPSNDRVLTITGGVRLGALYYAAWSAVGDSYEPATSHVASMLEQSASNLMVNTSIGNSPFVYPPHHYLNQAAQRGGEERLVAAWLYLHHRIGEEGLRRDSAMSRQYLDLGDRIYNVLSESSNNADTTLADKIARLIDKYEQGGTNGEQ